MVFSTKANGSTSSGTMAPSVRPHAQACAYRNRNANAKTKSKSKHQTQNRNLNSNLSLRVLLSMMVSVIAIIGVSFCLFALRNLKLNQNQSENPDAQYDHQLNQTKALISDSAVFIEALNVNRWKKKKITKTNSTSRYRKADADQEQNQNQIGALPQNLEHQEQVLQQQLPAQVEVLVHLPIEITRIARRMIIAKLLEARQLLEAYIGQIQNPLEPQGNIQNGNLPGLIQANAEYPNYIKVLEIEDDQLNSVYDQLNEFSVLDIKSLLVAAKKSPGTADPKLAARQEAQMQNQIPQNGQHQWPPNINFFPNTIFDYICRRFEALFRSLPAGEQALLLLTDQFYRKLRIVYFQDLNGPHDMNLIEYQNELQNEDWQALFDVQLNRVNGNQNGGALALPQVNYMHVVNLAKAKTGWIFMQILNSVGIQDEGKVQALLRMYQWSVMFMGPGHNLPIGKGFIPEAANDELYDGLQVAVIQEHNAIVAENQNQNQNLQQQNQENQEIQNNNIQIYQPPPGHDGLTIWNAVANNLHFDFPLRGTQFLNGVLGLRTGRGGNQQNQNNPNGNGSWMEDDLGLMQRRSGQLAHAFYLFRQNVFNQNQNVPNQQAQLWGQFQQLIQQEDLEGLGLGPGNVHFDVNEHIPGLAESYVLAVDQNGGDGDQINGEEILNEHLEIIEVQNGQQQLIQQQQTLQLHLHLEVNQEQVGFFQQDAVNVDYLNRVGAKVGTVYMNWYDNMPNQNQNVGQGGGGPGPEDELPQIDFQGFD